MNAVMFTTQSRKNQDDEEEEEETPTTACEFYFCLCIWKYGVELVCGVV